MKMLSSNQIPVSNFRAFIHSLKDEGVDMSHVSISRSYAVLVGLEAYMKSRRRGKKLVQKLIRRRDKILFPDEVARREEQPDKSERAAREQIFFEMKAQAEREGKEQSTNTKLLNKLRVRSKTGTRERESKLEGPAGKKKATEKAVDMGALGTGPESAIAPDGTRSEAAGTGPSNGAAPDSTKDI